MVMSLANPAYQYRVRLLKEPVLLYDGRSFEHAAHVMDMSTHDCILERREPVEWSQRMPRGLVDPPTWSEPSPSVLPRVTALKLSTFLGGSSSAHV
jgi:hypothetical protein